MELTKNVIRLHVGAHKTATTYLQQYLAQNRSVLAHHGTAYWDTQDIRFKFKLAWDQHRLDRRSLRARLGTRIRGDRIQMRMKEWFALDRDVLISEENLLGECDDFFGGAIYPDADARLALLAKVLPDKPLEVWLCLRGYPDFLASIYGEASRFWTCPAPEEFVERHAQPDGKWIEVIDRIRAALPTARLRVWTYENFRRLEPRLVEGMTGVAPTRLTPLAQSEVRASASAKAILRMAELPGSIRGAERQYRMLEMEHLHPIRDRSDRFSPWAETQRAQMMAAYRADLERIAARDDVDFIE
ncbi:hypothetical protein [Salipiger abyssi]|uniref:hypothetical protein n=1 Tax=Salipiger abyssi TaxID=1250539 RepID=UPI001A8FA79F|nr:hypothetical protein [Salipiger abyssi]MBN9890474.1 hypothetical protein [Salipiger abyssi]